MAFDPAPVEWMALLICLSISSLASSSFVLTAFSFHWKQWFLRPKTYHPTYLIPEAYGFARCLFVVLTGLAGFYVLQAGLRADPATTLITNTTFTVALSLYITFLALAGSFGWIFFWVGLQLSWIGLSFFWEVATLAVAVTMSYYFYTISLAAGIIMIIVSAFFLSSCVFTCLYWQYLIVEGIVMDPFTFMLSMVNASHVRTKAIMSQDRSNSPSRQVSQQNVSDVYPIQDDVELLYRPASQSPNIGQRKTSGGMFVIPIIEEMRNDD